MNISDLARKATSAHAAGRPNISLLRRLGIQPTVAVVFVMVDWLLFGGEISSGMASMPISVTAGIILGLWAIRRQHRTYGDTIKVSILKGLILGVLTAVPSPVGSFFTLIGGLLPLLDKMKDSKKTSPSEESASSDTPEMRNVTPKSGSTKDESPS